ncbi:carbohydrate ABC transporter permease [Dactylosporangium sp. CA-092794]|uniref:carbohydrate ABC transporter permease n=1 Tax=Dactylosporangium sp. CA-092794 TaxID=3239929 RepID=UPI003D8CFC75
MSTAQAGSGERLTRTALLAAMAAFAVLPLLSMLTAALAPQGTRPPGLAWPHDPQWHNFIDAWNTANLAALFGSSTLIVVGVVPAAVAFSALAGYSLAQLRPVAGRPVAALFLLGLTLPFEALITPLYYDIQRLGLSGSRLAVVLPLIGLLMPFGIFWMRAHFLLAEAALTEAARVDGAGTWQIFRVIHLPLARPALSALTILFFLATWNQYLLPLVLVDDPAKRTVAGGLGAFQGQYGTNTALLCAGSLIIIVPSLVVYVVFQRSFVTALLHGAVK